MEVELLPKCMMEVKQGDEVCVTGVWPVQADLSPLTAQTHSAVQTVFCQAYQLSGMLLIQWCKLGNLDLQGQARQHACGLWLLQ